METFDYVIIGAGSAGSVLANRLGEDSASRVCVLEAGLLTAFLHFSQQGLDLLELLAIAGPVSLAQEFLGA